MANRINKTADGTPDKLTRQDAAAALNYFSEPLSSARSRNKPRFDDLIVSLANAHENRRAQQVSEWERMRKKIFRSVAI